MNIDVTIHGMQIVERGDEVRRPAHAGQPAGEQERRNAGRRHDVSARDVHVLHVVHDQAVREERGDQERIELREAVDVDAVDARDERMRPRDRDREPLVAARVEIDVVACVNAELRHDRPERDPENPEADAVAPQEQRDAARSPAAVHPLRGRSGRRGHGWGWYSGARPRRRVSRRRTRPPRQPRPHGARAPG